MKRGFGLGDVVADRFKLLSEIGEGGMGRVFEAVDLRHDRPAAVKVIYRRLAADQVFRTRFEREALAAERATHPHVLPVWDHGSADDHLYIATPLCDTDLSGLLDEHGRLGAETALTIIGQIAWALDWAHARDVVHRDVKPENILLVAGPVERHAYLADFGLARIATSATLTQLGVSVGLSPAYAAPEQWLGKRVTAAADQYALAGTLYCCLTGRPPFWPARDFDALRDAHLEHDPPPMEQGSDPRLELASPALERGLAKDPADRYPSCGDLVVAVRAALTREDAALSLPGLGEHADPHATTEPEQPSSARVQDRRDAPVPPQVLAAAAPAAAPPEPDSVETRATDDGPADASDAVAAPAAPAERAPRRRVLVAALAAVIVAAGIAAVFALRGGSENAAGEVLSAVQLGGRPTDAVADGDSVWVADQAGATLRRLDTKTGKPTGAAVDVAEAPFRLSGADGRLWAISAAGAQASGIDLSDPSAKPRTVDLASAPKDVSVGDGAVWVAADASAPGEGGSVLALDPVSGDESNSVPTVFAVDGVAAGDGAIWALAGSAGRLYRIRPEAPAPVATIDVGTGSSAVVADATGVWVANAREGRLLRIDPAQNLVTQRISVERGENVGLAAGAGAIWWIDRDRGTVTRIDAAQNRQVGAALQVGDHAGGATVAAGRLWVTVPTDRSVVPVRF